VKYKDVLESLAVANPWDVRQDFKALQNPQKNIAIDELL
jgi:hypothetical protein